MKLVLLVSFTYGLLACTAPDATTAPASNSARTVVLAPRPSPTPAPLVLPTATPPPRADGNLDIILQRSGGFTGRTETFVLKPDGTVTMAFGNVQAPGGAAAARQLAQSIAASNLMSVPPGEYLPANACCDRYEFELTVVINGKSFHYVTLEGYDGAPAPLREALQLVQQYITAAQ